MAELPCSGDTDSKAPSNQPVGINSEENNEPLVIHPDKDLNLDSDSDNELEFCDALDNNDKPGIRDELSDIKSKKVDHDIKKANEKRASDPVNEGDNEIFTDAEDDENSEHALNDAELEDRKSEEIERRKEAEERLSEESKQVN